MTAISLLWLFVLMLATWILFARDGFSTGSDRRIVINFICPHPNGRFPHPFKCDRYIQCNDDGLPELRFCSDGKHFDNIIKCCRPKATAHCAAQKPSSEQTIFRANNTTKYYATHPSSTHPSSTIDPQYYSYYTNGTTSTTRSTSTARPRLLGGVDEALDELEYDI